MALAGNGRWCYLDPKLGAMHAVAEAARKVACTGATPVAATNCLNFGNPEKPEIMAQLSAAIDGIAEAATALGTPITGGNVSLYNETLGEGIYPTPVIGVVGLLDDVTKAVPNSFQRPGDDVLLISLNFEGMSGKTVGDMRCFGSSEYANTICQQLWGMVPVIETDGEAELHKILSRVASEGLASAIFDVADGGLSVSLARATFGSHIGVTANLTKNDATPWSAYFAEYASMAVVTCSPADADRIFALIEPIHELFCEKIGKTGGEAIRLSLNGETTVDCALSKAHAAFSSTLESQLAAEVVTA